MRLDYLYYKIVLILFNNYILFDSLFFLHLKVHCTFLDHCTFLVQLDLEKAEEPEIKLPTSIGSQKRQENSIKISTSVSLTTLKPLTVWITTNCGKFLKRWE